MKNQMKNPAEKEMPKKRLARRMWDGTKKFVAGVLISAALLAPKSAHAEGWATLWPGYSTNANRPTLRVEGGASFDSGTSFYAFGDFEPSKRDSIAIDSFFGAARVSQSVWNGLGLFGEIETGTGMDPIFKPGMSYTVPLEDWFIQLRLSPWMFGSKEDIQMVAYLSKVFGETLSTELLLKANLLSKTMYWEFAADILFADRFSVGSQLRMSTDFSTGHTDVTPVARVGIRF